MNEIDRRHILLSELHRLLGSYSAEEFVDASLRSVEFQKVLKELAQARQAGSPAARSGTETSNFNSGPSTSSSDGIKAEGVTASSFADAEEISDLLRRVGRADSFRSLQELSSRYGLSVNLSSKDGKQRSLSKVAKAIAFAPSKVRMKVIRDLTTDGQSVTQGWMRVIRGSE